LLSFALVIPAAGIVQAAGLSPVALAAVAGLLAGGAYLVFDAYRWIFIIHRYGVGIRGVLGNRTVWISWQEIVELDTEDDILEITTREPAIYQVQTGRRPAELVSRMVERNLVA
jgi:hypothetical protein